MTGFVAAATGALAIVFGIAYFVVRGRVAGLEQRLRHAHTKLEELERSFQRFAPPEVVERLAADNMAIEPGAREVTVLFADVQGFTTMSEQLDPVVLVEMLNGYFHAMDTAIGAHHGRISKFMGDGLMALFGAIDANPWKAQDAVRAALAMRAALVTYNATLQEQGRPSLAIGVGIHSGVVFAGVMGSQRLKEFTVIGDVVNTAARIEGLTRKHETDILITQAVRDGLDERFSLRAMEPTPVKGKAEPVMTFAVDGFEA